MTQTPENSGDVGGSDYNHCGSSDDSHRGRYSHDSQDATILDAPPSPQGVADIVFGETCPPCSTEVPCGCNYLNGGTCVCTCGRCLWPYPLPDDGPLP